ncbi:hypothetical protein [Pseudomonas citronellolis]|uniref:hypothetical protein n=1 Tax=Pseudomonas citronellolis TaxID=53408 RepID=UPI0021BEDA5D|nr:hypothetical protein [Pseudomonas citronellolis]MDN6874369.1 hypothetical protein [Pseudomonas citronellolis]UXJ53397.1 hypothetical protein N5P21_04025 [Pseudomonas citronellolis]
MSITGTRGLFHGRERITRAFLGPGLGLAGRFGRGPANKVHHHKIPPETGIAMLTMVSAAAFLSNQTCLAAIGLQSW